MTLNLKMPTEHDLKPRITVFGVGGAGGNAVNNMIEKSLDGVDFVVANTDAQALQATSANNRVQMGVKVTEGLGAGARPAVGAAAAEESIEEIVDYLAGAHMCFITAGMGGGTGTGAAPIIAQAARELGVLTVGVVTKPFQFEGAKRMRQAEDGVEQLQKVVDTLIIIPNQNLFRLANENTTFTEAFSMADDVLYQGVKGVTDLMVRPGLINLDFADVRAVMDEMGKAMMGTGEAEGEDRAIQAAEKAIANPLLDEISLNGAKGVLINITGSHDLTLFELDEAANRIREEVDPDANIIVGSTLDEDMNGRMRVSVVATGIDASEVIQDIPVPRRRLSEPLKPQTQAAAPASHSAADIPSQAPGQALTLQDEMRHQPYEEPAQEAFFDDHYETPVAAEPEPEELLAREMPRYQSSEPSFFEQMEPSAPAQYAEDFDDDELPEPVYQPTAAQRRQAQYDTQYEQFDDSVEEAEFVAPKPLPLGTPSPETMARLKTAVGNAPSARPRGGAAPEFRRPAAQPQQAPHQSQGHAAEDKSRFGINSLISRMTGHGNDSVDQSLNLRREGSLSRPMDAQMHDEPVDEEQERIEIPAFLRRQAN